MDEMNHHQFVFLCGLHRSGTSPLFRILRDHPQISGFRNTGVPEDEGQHLQSVFPPAHKYGGPGRFGFNPEARLTEDSPILSLENQRKLFQEWSSHWDLTRPYLLEKSPPNLIRTRFLQAAFPSSYFVVITRHPVAVSLATVKWTNSTLESLIEHWLRCHELFELDRPRLRRVIVIKYETLIDSKDVDEIFNFLGLSPRPIEALDRSGNEKYFASWRRLLIDKDGRKVARSIIAKYEKHLQRHGYSFDDTELAGSRN